jgi:hypothetical protein
MSLDLTAALVVFLAVAVWRFARRRRPSRGKPLPDVGSAPPSADPVAVPWWNDDGLGMHYREVPATTHAEESGTTE